MNRTKIEWALNPDGTPGYTWNPITGCLNGCEYCYARRLANTRLRERYLDWSFHMDWATYCEIPQIEVEQMHKDPFYPRFWPERLEQPFCSIKGHPYNAKPRGIFTCDMGELFGPWLPDKWVRQVFDIIRLCEQHRFYLLTKQPQELVKWSPFPENCYVGVTACNQEMFIDALMELAKIEATVKYISFEPLLEAMNGGECEGKRLDALKDAGISWLIIGAQTKPYKPPRIEWVKEIVEAADKAGIPVFLKNNLKPLFTTIPIIDAMKYDFWEEFEVSVIDDSRSIVKLRQEMP